MANNDDEGGLNYMQLDMDEIYKFNCIMSSNPHENPDMRYQINLFENRIPKLYKVMDNMTLKHIDKRFNREYIINKMHSSPVFLIEIIRGVNLLGEIPTNDNAIDMMHRALLLSLTLDGMIYG